MVMHQLLPSDCEKPADYWRCWTSHTSEVRHCPIFQNMHTKNTRIWSAGSPRAASDSNIHPVKMECGEAALGCGIRIFRSTITAVLSISSLDTSLKRRLLEHWRESMTDHNFERAVVLIFMGAVIPKLLCGALPIRYSNNPRTVGDLQSTAMNLRVP
jgi:hypothetical protein